MPVNFLNNERHTSNFRKGIVRDRFDEPTYLTFSLDFNFDNGTREDDFLGVSPLFNTKEGVYQSAINYLLMRNHVVEANQLSVFKKLLTYLRDDAPWYFQSIQGIDKLWGKATKMEEPMKGGDITVSTLEAVDLRMTELADLYRNSVYDKQFMRERVPDNLRWFSMDIWIAEFRNLRNSLPPLVNLGSTLNVSGPNLGGITGASNKLGNVLKDYSYIRMRCRQCEFDFEDSFPGGTDVKIGGTTKESESSKFKIKVGWMEETNKYSSGSETFDNYTSKEIRGNSWNKKSLGIGLDSASSFLTGLPVVGNKIDELGAKATDSINSVLKTPNRLINQGMQELSQLVDQGRLGQASIYGYESNGDVIPPNTAVPKTKE